jgi:hypothetical protein
MRTLKKTKAQRKNRPFRPWSGRIQRPPKKPTSFSLTALRKAVREQLREEAEASK